MRYFIHLKYLKFKAFFLNRLKYVRFKAGYKDLKRIASFADILFVLMKWSIIEFELHKIFFIWRGNTFITNVYFTMSLLLSLYICIKFSLSLDILVMNNCSLKEKKCFALLLINFQWRDTLTSRRNFWEKLFYIFQCTQILFFSGH